MYGPRVYVPEAELSRKADRAEPGAVVPVPLPIVQLRARGCPGKIQDRMYHWGVA